MARPAGRVRTSVCDFVEGTLEETVRNYGRSTQRTGDRLEPTTTVCLCPVRVRWCCSGPRTVYSNPTHRQGGQRERRLCSAELSFLRCWFISPFYPFCPFVGGSIRVQTTSSFMNRWLTIFSPVKALSLGTGNRRWSFLPAFRLSSRALSPQLELGDFPRSQLSAYRSYFV